MKRFDDFPRGKQFEGSKRLRYNLDEVTQWLERRNLAGSQRATISVLAPFDSEEQRNLLGTLFVVLQKVGLVRRPDADAVIDVYRTMEERDEADLLNYDLSSVANTLPQLIETYAELTDSERADVLITLDETSEGRAQPSFSTPSALVEFLAGLIGDETGVVVDLASGKGRVLEHLERKGIGSDHFGVEINTTLVTQAKQIATLRKSRIQYLAGDSLKSATPRPARIVVADPPLRLDHAQYEPEAINYGSISPVAGESPSAFIVRAIEALEPGGRGFVLSGVPLLQARGAKEFRRQLILAGCVKAVVSLPPRLKPDTPIPLALWIVGPPDPELSKVVMADASTASVDELGSDGPVVRAIRAELNGDATNQDDSYAVSVTPLSLMTEDIMLRPHAWVSKKRDLIEPQEQLAKAREGIAQLASISGEIGLHSASLVIGHVEPPLVTLGSLQERGGIKLLRPVTVRTSEEGTGPPVLEQRVIARQLEPQDARRLLDSNTRGLQVEPGDIVVGLGLAGVEAIIWQEEGWVAGSTVQVIRARPEHVDATFLCNAISHPRNRAHIDPGAFRVHANLVSFEVPDLPLPEQKIVSSLLEEINRIEKEARMRFDQLLVAKRALSEALGSGTIALRENHE